MEKILLKNWTQSQTEPDILAVHLANDVVEIDMFVPANLFQFQGHFPDEPILPGVAQLDWAARLSGEYFCHHGRFSKLSRIKFLRLIRANSRLMLRMEIQHAKRRLRFSYQDDKAICSTGYLELAQE